MSVFNEDLLQKIRDFLISRSENISVAESVTSGLLQLALSQMKDAGWIYQGGITAYNLGQKVRHLQVCPIAAEDSNSVSQKVADQMALGVARMFTSTYSLSITGYSSQVGCDDPELYAYTSISKNGEIIARMLILNERGLEGYDLQLYYTHRLLERFLEVAQSESKKPVKILEEAL